MRLLLPPSLILLLSGCFYIPQFEVDLDGDGWSPYDLPDAHGLRDCDDDDPTVYPGAIDLRGDRCDSDCGAEPDADGDDWPDSADCAPYDPDIFPCNPEEVVGDGKDSDCDGRDGVRWIDCETADPRYDEQPEQLDSCENAPVGEALGEKPSVLKDGDGDGFLEDVDCNDLDEDVYPGADETCDGVDQDCDGDVDEDPVDGLSGFADGDGDGFGADGETRVACAGAAGFATEAGDCDDTDAAVSPGATEIPDNGVDDDCDASTPDTADADADADGFTADEDCDDGDAAVNPGATEICNDGVDDDCDGLADDADSTLDGDTRTAWYADADYDGYGDPDSPPLRQCAAPLGMVADATDCDDDDEGVNPGATEVTGNGKDDDCDPSTPDGSGADLDGDGFEAPEDCDDTRADVYPGAAEACDGADGDCNGVVDDGEALGRDGVCAAPSCAAILTADPGAGDGVYFLEPVAGKIVETWCEMTDGGWTLALLKNSVDGSSLFTDAYQYGVGFHEVGLLAGDPAETAISSYSVPVRTWIDLNEAEYRHLRFTSWSAGARTHTTDAIPRDALRLAFGESGFHLWDAPADPPRSDGQTYYWCGGAREFTDGGVGQVDPPPGAPAGCKRHTGLGSGWDLSFDGETYNRGLTLCGGEDPNALMHSKWGGGGVKYPTAGAAQALWIR